MAKQTAAEHDDCKANPRALLFSARFWARHVLFVLAAAGTVLALLAVWNESVAQLTSTKLAIGVAILVLAGYAAFEAAVTLAMLDVERALGTHLISRGEAKLREVRANPATRHKLENLSTFLPDNPTKPTVARLFAHVLEAARDREFGTSATLAQMYRAGLIARFQKIDRLQQIALRLGILGTFIGLGEAMRKVPDGLRVLSPGVADAATRQAQLVDTAQSLVAFLADAFGTSILGLVVACGISAMVFVVRSHLARYNELMEHSAEVSLSLARNALNESDFQVAFERLIQRLDELKVHLFDRVAKLGDSIDALKGTVGGQTSEMTNAQRQLKVGAQELSNLMQELSGRQSELLEEYRSSVDQVGFTVLFAQLEGAIEKAGDSVGAHLARDLSQISGHLSELSAAVRSGAGASTAPPPRPDAGDSRSGRGGVGGFNFSAPVGLPVHGATTLERPKPIVTWGMILASGAVILAMLLGLALR